MTIALRIKSDIFNEWMYSNSHYRLSDFIKRWEGQYANEPNYNPIMQQYINNEWIDIESFDVIDPL